MPAAPAGLGWACYLLQGPEALSGYKQASCWPLAAKMSSTVKLISSDGFEFVVDRKAACVSNTIKQMLSADGERSEGLTV